MNLGRFQLIQRIGQQAAQTGPQTLSGHPTQVNLSAIFPAVVSIWGSNNLAPIQQLLNTVNMAIWVLSAGQVDFNTLRMQNFTVDISKYPDQTLAAIIRLAGVIYRRMLSLPVATKPLTAEDKAQIISEVERSLNSSAIPDSGINAFLQTKIGGGSFKAVLNALLPRIK